MRRRSRQDRYGWRSDLRAYDPASSSPSGCVEQLHSASESRPLSTRIGSFVGRQEEMGLLLRAWEGSRGGRGQVVLIQGEAGVGKSRLVEGLREATAQDHIWVAIRCSPFIQRAPFIRSSNT